LAAGKSQGSVRIRFCYKAICRMKVFLAVSLVSRLAASFIETDSK